MTADQELEQVLSLAAARRVKIVEKTGWFWKTLAFFIYVLSLGKTKDFLTDYVTTIGHTIAVPVGWMQSESTVGKAEILTHELTHVDQFDKFTPVLMALLYLLVFFPVGGAYFRYRFEREAYVNGFRVALRYGADREGLVQHGVDQMTGPNYLWAWPFKASVRKYFEDSL